MSAKRFENILICTDLDGTLLNEQREISQENLAAIDYFKSQGGYFTFVTGRQRVILDELCDAVQPNAPVGCFNGAALFNSQTNEFIWSAHLTDSAAEIVDYVETYFPQVGIQLNTETDMFYQTESTVTVGFRERTHTAYQYGNFRTVKDPIVKVVFASEDGECLDRLSERIRKHPKAQQFDFIRSEYMFFELLPKNISKGNALKILADHLKIDIQNTLAIGDYDNDVSMIKLAGVGVAVANASPSAKAAAERMTVSNNEHAIAKVIDDIDKGIIRLAR